MDLLRSARVLRDAYDAGDTSPIEVAETVFSRLDQANELGAI